MPALIEQMQAAQQRGQPTTKVPGSSVAALLSGTFGPTSTPTRPVEPTSASQPYHPPHTICGATPCPHCASTWIIETYGPTGRTLCHGCRAPRSQLGLWDWEEPRLTPKHIAATSATVGHAATTITQFIDAVIAAGYPQLAEIARKYQQQPMASQPTAHQPTANQLANQPGQTK